MERHATEDPAARVPLETVPEHQSVAPSAVSKVSGTSKASEFRMPKAVRRVVLSQIPEPLLAAAEEE